MGLVYSCVRPSVASALLYDGIFGMSGNGYTTAIQVHYNCVYSKARTDCGRNWSRAVGYLKPCKLQQCFSKHSLRILLHNDFLNNLARSLEQRGYSVHRDSLFHANDSRLKPDLVLYCIDHTYVVDSPVI